MYLSTQKSQLNEYICRQINNIFPDGNDIKLAASASVINENIPDNMICFGQSKKLIFKENKNSFIKYHFAI